MPQTGGKRRGLVGVVVTLSLVHSVSTAYDRNADVKESQFYIMIIILQSPNSMGHHTWCNTLSHSTPTGHMQYRRDCLWGEYYSSVRRLLHRQRTDAE